MFEWYQNFFFISLLVSDFQIFRDQCGVSSPFLKLVLGLPKQWPTLIYHFEHLGHPKEAAEHQFLVDLSKHWSSQVFTLYQFLMADPVGFASWMAAADTTSVTLPKAKGPSFIAFL